MDQHASILFWGKASLTTAVLQGQPSHYGFHVQKLDVAGFER
jgi:hypothetical protein